MRAGGLPPCVGEREFGISITNKTACGSCGALLMIGVAPANFPLATTGGACTLLLDPLILLPVGAGGIDQFFRHRLPNNPALRGGQIYYQGAAVDYAASWSPLVRMTDALRVTIR